MRHLFPALLTLAVLALGACGGGGGESAPSDGEPPISSGELVVRTVRHDSNLAPVSGVSVLLHGPDGRSVERMLTSDADGYARFGDVGRERVTLTTVVGARRITLIDVPEDEYVIRVLPRDNSVSEPFVPCEGLRNISVTSETNDGEYIRLYPRSSVVTTDDESIEFPSQAVCDMHESVDGTVPIMIGDGVLVDERPDGQIYAYPDVGTLYGFAAVPSPADGELVVINRSIAYAAHPWTSEEKVGGIQIFGYDRAGSLFELGFGPADETQRAGTVFLADQVVLPTYRLLGGFNGTTTVDSDTHDSFLLLGSYVSQLSTALPAQLHLNTPSLAITDIVHDQVTAELRFSGDLPSVGPLIRVLVELYDEGYSNFRRWTFYLPSSHATLQIPTIPASVSTRDFESQNWVTEGTLLYAAVLEDGDNASYGDALALRFGERALAENRHYRYADYWRENYPLSE